MLHIKYVNLNNIKILKVYVKGIYVTDYSNDFIEI